MDILDLVDLLKPSILFLLFIQNIEFLKQLVYLSVFLLFRLSVPKNGARARPE